MTDGLGELVSERRVGVSREGRAEDDGVAITGVRRGEVTDMLWNQVCLGKTMVDAVTRTDITIVTPTWGSAYA